MIFHISFPAYRTAVGPQERLQPSCHWKLCLLSQREDVWNLRTSLDHKTEIFRLNVLCLWTSSAEHKLVTTLLAVWIFMIYRQTVIAVRDVTCLLALWASAALQEESQHHMVHTPRLRRALKLAGQPSCPLQEFRSADKICGNLHRLASRRCLVDFSVKPQECFSVNGGR